MDIPLEQLVYGSFPFWDRGYDVLARSPGCREDWAAEVLAACRRFGEAPSGVTPASALFSIGLPSGPRAIVGVEPQGVDDRGRPGALAFHALLVDPRDYRKAGSDPFAFAGALRRDWSSETTLSALGWSVEARKPLGLSTEDPRARRIVAALARGRRVAFESAGPIDHLARDVWASLPESTRRRASVATWAFGNANRFDLVALPRLAGVELDRSYLDLASIDSGAGPEPTARPHRLPPYYVYGGSLVIAVLVGLMAVWAWPRPRPTSETSATRPVEAEAEAAPAPTLASAGQDRVVAGLTDLADRLEVEGATDLGDLMARIADRFHYRGATLTPAELARLTSEADPDRDRALAWHERITRTFLDDRPWPEDFATLSLARQLDCLARSFHLAPATVPEAIPAALRDILARAGPIRPTPLAARYPPLSDYARFLARLPRRD